MAREPLSFDTDVLIVGAGPTGLTLACGLARSGVACRIIEASPEPQQGSRGKGIQPRTLEVFDNLGIVDAVVAHGRFSMPMRTIDADGTETLAGGGSNQPRPDTPYTASLITPEWRIEEALRNRLAEFGGRVDFGTELIDFSEIEGGVSINLAERGAAYPFTARWLVGCDGGHSIVRKHAGIAFAGETMDAIRMIVADVGVDGIEPDAWHVWRSEEGLAALCPLPSTDQFQLQIGIAPGQDPDLSLANMQATIDRRSRRTDIRLREPSWSSLWRANVRMVDRYRAGRVFLAGDAAHIHSPAGGQGMNTGIQDAHNLAWKLAAVINGAPSVLLDTYQKERLPIAADVLALSNNLLRKAIAEHGIALARDDRTMQLRLGYRTSSLSWDDRAGDARLRAGDRAPDASGLVVEGREHRLFDLLRGDHFTLLAFGKERFTVDGETALPVKVYNVVQNPREPGELQDRDGLLAAAYGTAEGTAILIRPDGYIAFISATETQQTFDRAMHTLFGDRS